MYYYLASIIENKIEVLRDSNETEYTSIQALQASVHNFMMQNKRSSYEKKAFERISRINVALLSGKHDYNVDDLNNAISEYLFAFRKFLDNWETHIKREYGEDSELFKTFKKATVHAHSNNIEYKIVYQLRNADQHCDKIVTSISVGTEDNGERYIEAKAKTDYLLTVYKKWKTDEKEYLHQHENIDIFRFLSVTHKCIQRIHLELMNFFCTESLYEDCCAILEKSNEYYTQRNGLSFLCQEEELTKEFFSRPRKTLNNHSWMVRECIDLLKIFFRNNLNVVSVLYYGNRYSDLIKEIATELKSEEYRQINVGGIVNISGMKYRCYSMRTDILSGSSVIVAINSKIPTTQEKTINDQFSRYLQALLGSTY